MKGSDGESDYLKQLEAQRKAFEAQFGSLESMGFEDKTKHVSEDGSADPASDSSEHSSEESANDRENEEASSSEDENVDIPVVVPSGMGASQTAKKNKPKTIKFDGPSDTYVPLSKQEQKLVRSGKTLSHIAKQAAKRDATKKPVTEDDNLEEENLAKDVELQQFLSESHLLSAFSNGIGSNNPTSGVGLTLESLSNGNQQSVVYHDDEVMGKARMKTLEARLRGVSSANGRDKKVNKLEKVPMHIRRGMIDKHTKRIAQYERDAAEGGIILSKVKKGQFRKIEATYKKDIERRIGGSIRNKDLERSAKRERGLRINSIGRSTRNGLVVSKDEIARINGTNSNTGKNQKQGKRRRR
ncbi:Faf1p KNAG_0L01220 [Huiozyma naganishii CBS 8797]|uniref:Protein FAF1 n=1 Tax=Huiozyma naganishii (strain ATCC MYA-139 / BCRC 22969 / CBS 8797 / KCTC 17520 / NBRC 10181 / NCYC 3082 / Yp74L-3) TaxID=1071383 RepID=J7S3P3_HUIN7|nr:hypothetical protein KNAG_0L01220 [Kazachstania naganishii CBS 8797]CCK72742.1 hypothetical protein KNAG_0L01220 [Kazachstania naganishii CBS 8797]